jgi:L-amino acid N-acyltransferase YncA
MTTRTATREDASAIARIYNQGIEDRVATFETRLRAAADVEAWFDGIHPVVVLEDAGEVIAWAATSTYRPRECYATIAEVSVYVARASRRRGAGRAVLAALFDAARRAGFHKLVSRVFPENVASLGMIESLGFCQVGMYRRHGKLDGVWRDVVVVEKLLD